MKGKIHRFHGPVRKFEHFHRTASRVALGVYHFRRRAGVMLYSSWTYRHWGHCGPFQTRSTPAAWCGPLCNLLKWR